MATLNSTIHQPARLRIMAALMTIDPGTPMDFTSLGKLLNLTDGNLGAHLQTLEQAGYITIEKTFVDRKPRTRVSLTPEGRYQYEEHVTALKQILGS